MLFQVEEMLLVEKGGEEQLADELAAYNPLVPQGSELVATVMFEAWPEGKAPPYSPMASAISRCAMAKRVSESMIKSTCRP